MRLHTSRLWIHAGTMLVGVLVASQAAKADWIDTFDGGFDQSWSSVNVTSSLGSSGTFSFASDGSKLVVSDPTSAVLGGATLGFGYVSESFSNVRVTGTLNPDLDSNMNAHLSLIARGNPALVQAYIFGVDWFDTVGVPKGFVYLQRADSLASIPYLDTDLISGFSLTDSVFLDFVLLGSSIVGRVYDQEGGTLLASVSAVDGTYSSGVSGVAVSIDEGSLGLRGTFDNVTSSVVREPASGLLALIGGGAMLFVRRRRRESRGGSLQG